MLRAGCSQLGSKVSFFVRVIATGTLKSFWENPGCQDAEQPLRAWLRVAKAATWTDPIMVKKTFGSADILRDGRVVFDISGNKYRMVVWIIYKYRVIYVRFIGTHRAYDRIDAQTF
jgi:mRNA interferase HigB